MHIARTGLAVAATLLTLSSCGSAEDLAAPDPGGPSSTTDGTDEPSDDPTQTPDKTETPEEPSTPVPEVGDCRRLDGDTVYSGYTDGGAAPISCGKRHNTQTVYVTSAKGATKKALKRGDSNTIFETMLPRCRAKVASWTGSEVARLGRTTFGVVVGVPPGKDVALGANWIRCDASLDGADGRPIALPKQTKCVLRNDTSEYDLCVRGDFSRRGTTIVPCSKSHDYRAVASIRLGDPATRYPGEGKVRKVLKRRCPSEALSFLGSSARYGYTYPTQQQWSTSTGFGTCYALTKR